MGRVNVFLSLFTTSFVLLSLTLTLPAFVSPVYIERTARSTKSVTSLDTPDKFNVTQEEYETIQKLFAELGIADTEAAFQKHVKCMDRLNEIEREINGINCSATGQKCDEKFLKYVVNDRKKNPHSKAHLYQGDIKLNSDQVENMCADGEKRFAKFRAGKGKEAPSNTGGGRRRRRHFLGDPAYNHLWNINPIPYTTTGNVVVSDIKGAIDLLQANTCLQFVYNPQLAPGQYGFNFSAWNNDYCDSPVGMQSQIHQPQVIDLPSVANEGCGIAATVHEMCHSLGSKHEQMRPDRDQYVYVDTSNIQSQWLFAFTPADSKGVTYGSPYDYISEMHYGPAAFSIDGTKPNIETLDPDFQESIGQDLTPMTHYDYYVLNQAYCKPKCQGIQGPNCTNGGYQNPLNCGQCKCSFMFTGTDCSILKESPPICNQTKLIAQPGVQQTLTFSGKAQCYISITASDGLSNVSLYINKLDYGFESYLDTTNRGCPVYSDSLNSYVEVNAGLDFGLNGARFCYYDDVYNYPIVSSGPKLYIFYNSMDSYWTGSFEANYYY